MNNTIPFVFNSVQKQEFTIETDKRKENKKSVFFLKQNIGSNHQIEKIPNKKQIKTNNEKTEFSEPEDTKRLFINMMKTIKTKQFVNKLKKTSIFSSSVPEKPLLINDLTYFDSKALNNDDENKNKKCIKIIFLWNFLKEKIVKKMAIKLIHPFEKQKIFWDIFLFLNTLLLFFYIPFTMAFDFLEKEEREFFQQIQFVIYLIDMIINLNTSYIDNGILIKDRMKVFSNYMRTFFLWDLLTIISLAGKNDYFPQGKSNHFDFLFFVQLFFFTKIKLFYLKYQNLKEIFCLDKKLKGSFSNFIF